MHSTSGPYCVEFCEAAMCVYVLIPAATRREQMDNSDGNTEQRTDQEEQVRSSVSVHVLNMFF